MSHEQDIHPFSFPSADHRQFNLNEYEGLLNELNQQVRQKQPEDLLQFCAYFFLKKLEMERVNHRGELCLSSTTNPFDKCEDESRDGVSDLHSMAMASLSSRGRRTSVSAESLQPTSTHDFVKTVIPKSNEQRERIGIAVSSNFLFKNLDDEQHVDVVNAMVEKRVTKDAMVIEQGGVGDYFYIVESGTLDCLINGKKVTEYTAGGSFGELALMYNAPRAATIVATDDCVLWALDRVAFRMILMENTARKRRMYDLFLSEVPIFKSLEPYERHKIADALEPVQLNDGHVVIKENDVGDNFYLIEQGNAIFYKTAHDGSQQEVNRLSKGDYFGELALLNDKPRAATVVAAGKLKCVTLGKKAFIRLLGPVMDILQRNSENYHAILKQANE
ncbi:unnamed protein product [Absidia cylindrospora]